MRFPWVPITAQICEYMDVEDPANSGAARGHKMINPWELRGNSVRTLCAARCSYASRRLGIDVRLRFDPKYDPKRPQYAKLIFSGRNGHLTLTRGSGALPKLAQKSPKQSKI